jgi:hypothetical protein
MQGCQRRQSCFLDVKSTSRVSQNYCIHPNVSGCIKNARTEKGDPSPNFSDFVNLLLDSVTFFDYHIWTRKMRNSEPLAY